MSYLEIAQLTDDPTFQARVRACTVQEAQVERELGPQAQALVEATLRGGGETTLAFVRLMAASPGFVTDLASQPGPGEPSTPQPPGPPRFDQGRISDAAILSQAQAQWETVAEMFFDENGDHR